jgi:hypothetical protein
MNAQNVVLFEPNWLNRGHCGAFKTEHSRFPGHTGFPVLCGRGVLTAIPAEVEAEGVPAYYFNAT